MIEEGYKNQIDEHILVILSCTLCTNIKLCDRSGRGGGIGQRHLEEHSGALVQQRLEAHARHVQVEHERLEVVRVRALSARELERHRAALRPASVGSGSTSPTRRAQ